MFDFIQSKHLMWELANENHKKLRNALEDAKKQSAVWCKHVPKPAVSGDGLIDPEDAQRYFKQCFRAVENGLVETAQRLSPAQWLWYLRRFPHIHSAEDSSFEDYSLTLATILSAKSQRKNDSKQFNMQLDFPLNRSIFNYILAFVAGSYHLADLHTLYGAAGREIPFRNRRKRLPDPVLTESKRKAGQIFDARQQIGSPGLTGTIASQNERSETSQILVVHRVYQPIVTPLPYFEFRGLETPPFFPSYYLPERVHLEHISNLYKLTDNGNGNWLNHETFSLMLLAGLFLPISASSPEYSMNIAMYGYSVHERSDLIMDYWAAFDELVSVFKRLFPDADLPDDFVRFVELFNYMEKLGSSTHPLLPGVLLVNDNWVIIDHANVKTRLDKILQFPSLSGETGQKRGFHFEDAIQSYIDASPWKPSDELQAMRQVHLIRSGDGTQITDIDAIGESSDTFLIISCKAVIFNIGQDIGEYYALQNARIRLDEAVLKWQDVKAELINSPIGQNYDFSRYRKIIAIVCTPNVVYTESELSLSDEVTGIRKAATALELIDWLQH